MSFVQVNNDDDSFIFVFAILSSFGEEDGCFCILHPNIVEDAVEDAVSPVLLVGSPCGGWLGTMACK